MKENCSISTGLGENYCFKNVHQHLFNRFIYIFLNFATLCILGNAVGCLALFICILFKYISVQNLCLEQIMFLEKVTGGR